MAPFKSNNLSYYLLIEMFVIKGLCSSFRLEITHSITAPAPGRSLIPQLRL